MSSDRRGAGKGLHKERWVCDARRGWCGAQARALARADGGVVSNFLCGVGSEKEHRILYKRKFKIAPDSIHILVSRNAANLRDLGKYPPWTAGWLDLL